MSSLKKPTAPTTRTTLRVESLDDRTVPAVVDLTTAGSVGSVGGVFFQQYDASSTTAADVSPFLSLQAGDGGRMERGYNTDAAPQYHTLTARALSIAELQLVNVGGVDYREILLDTNEGPTNPLISLEELKLYVSNSNTLRGYRNDGTLGGVQPVYNLDAGENSLVALNNQLNASGYGDMRMLVPDSALTGGSFVYLYCNLGKQNPVNDGAEEWSVRLSPPPPPPPPPPAGNSGITGLVFSDSIIQNDQQDDGEEVLPFRTVFLDEDNDGFLDTGEINVTSAEDGRYEFTGLAAGTYMVWVQVSGTESTHGYEIVLPADTVEPRDLAVRPTGGGGGS